MKPITVAFNTAATAEVVIQENCVLQAVSGLVRGTVSSDPSLTGDQMMAPAANQVLATILVFPNYGSGVPLGIQLRKGESLFISPQTSDVPGWVQLWIEPNELIV